MVKRVNQPVITQKKEKIYTLPQLINAQLKQ